MHLERLRYSLKYLKIEKNLVKLMHLKKQRDLHFYLLIYLEIEMGMMTHLMMQIKINLNLQILKLTEKNSLMNLVIVRMKLMKKVKRKVMHLKKYFEILMNLVRLKHLGFYLNSHFYLLRKKVKLRNLLSQRLKVRLKAMHLYWQKDFH